MEYFRVASKMPRNVSALRSFVRERHQCWPCLSSSRCFSIRTASSSTSTFSSRRSFLSDSHPFKNSGEHRESGSTEDECIDDSESSPYEPDTSRRTLRLSPTDLSIFQAMEPVQDNSLCHSTSPEAWASISSSRVCKGFVPADRRYDGLPADVPPPRSVHFVANPSSDGAVFPFSRYPKSLPHGAAIKILSLDASRFTSSSYLLFYIGSTPTQWGPEFLRAYHTHVCVVATDDEEKVQFARRHFIPITKENNAVFHFDKEGGAHVSTRIIVGGYTFPNTVLVSILGDFAFADISDISVRDGHKIGWASDKVSCPVTECTFRRESLSQLKRHYKAVHLGLKLEECGECDRTFSRRDSLEQHVAEVHRLENRHKCAKCDSTFSRKSGLAAHTAAVHRDEKPHKCPECDRSFTHRPYLRVHIASVHRKERPHSCAECDKSFSQSSSLAFHVASAHRKERTQQCPECDRFFSTRSYLRMHIAGVHHKEKPHSCPMCERKFAQRSHLTVHIAGVHHQDHELAPKDTQTQAASM